MDQQRRRQALVTVLVALLLLPVVLASTVSLSHSGDLQVGQSFVVTLDAVGVEDLQGVQFDLSYDQNMVELTGVTDGEILSPDQVQPFVLDDPTADYVAVRMSKASAPEDGVLATADFLAKSSGRTTIRVDSILLVAKDGTEIPVTTEPTTITISSPARSSGGGGSGGAIWYRDMQDDVEEEAQAVQEDAAADMLTQELSSEESQEGETSPVEVEQDNEPVEETQVSPTTGLVADEAEYQGAMYAWIAGLVVAGILGTGIGVMTNKSAAEYQPAADYIKQMRQLGYADETSWLQLRSVGWDDDWITQAFMAAG